MISKYDEYKAAYDAIGLLVHAACNPPVSEYERRLINSCIRRLTDRVAEILTQASETERKQIDRYPDRLELMEANI